MHLNNNFICLVFFSRKTPGNLKNTNNYKKKKVKEKINNNITLKLYEKVFKFTMVKEKLININIKK